MVFVFALSDRSENCKYSSKLCRVSAGLSEKDNGFTLDTCFHCSICYIHIFLLHWCEIIVSWEKYSTPLLYENEYPFFQFAKNRIANQREMYIPNESLLPNLMSALLIDIWKKNQIGAILLVERWNLSFFLYFPINEQQILIKTNTV